MRGFTLIELIVVLAIVSILMGFAVPTIGGIKDRSEATTRVNWIISAVNYTRHAAISFKTLATLCPIDQDAPTLSCGGEWHEDLMVFSDKNRDGRFNGNDEVIQRIQALSNNGTIKWRSFRNRQYLQITSSGYTNYQNGNFTYCSPDQNPLLARQVVVNVQARARVTHYKAEDGSRLDRRGHPLRC